MKRLEVNYADEVHKYIMVTSNGNFIDATKKGNIGRFLNHSCEPNAVVVEWNVKGEARMGVFAKEAISPGQEIYFDYNFQPYGEPQVCYCGAESCTGQLGMCGVEFI